MARLARSCAVVLLVLAAVSVPFAGAQPPRPPAPPGAPGSGGSTATGATCNT
eukprot:CAMPEP_0174843272 /NCGR_PEP_ID=MMETSP1114-20130205/10409_1 /TAXON_ID=312471 /ORGANISM="Neobodo designis, Strain CCAP 1951/1" /LENGTH=51 /DNA_ID=CAMNT_0016077487 /DNA_START=1 /DNA_END=152 /DNA_ORIENTATION=+